MCDPADLPTVKNARLMALKQFRSVLWRFKSSKVKWENRSIFFHPFLVFVSSKNGFLPVRELFVSAGYATPYDSTVYFE